jgi:hypothetical protein
MRRILMILLRVLAWLWALPNTLIGLPLLAIAAATGGRAALVDGVFEAYGGSIRWVLARLPLGGRDDAAVTLGHVILGSSREALDLLRAHERVHVAQYERWGPFFLPAYAVASLWARLQGVDSYRDNPFEREAYAIVDPIRPSEPVASAEPDPQERNTG